MALGKEARNCLVGSDEARDRFHDGQSIWALRSAEGKLLAVAQVDADNVLCELRGPRNSDSLSGYGPDIIAWCHAAELTIWSDLTVPLVEFSLSGSNGLPGSIKGTTPIGAG